MAEKPCTFCDYDTKRHRIVAETENFYALPTIGQISDGGHMMIIPRRHYSCLGAMEDDAFAEFEELTGNVERAVTVAYQKPILFEHGILGQSVSHAHLQMMPSDADLFTRINNDFRVFRKLGSFKELQEMHKTKGVYLFYENTHDEKFGFLLDSYPQYLRIIAAEAIGKPKRGNWREWRADPECAALDDRLIDETVKRLRQEMGLPPPSKD